MAIELLNPDTLATLAAGKEHNDGGGLYLVIEKTGAARWSFKFTPKHGPVDEHGKRKGLRMGLGGLDSRSIYDARKLCATFRELVRDGQDPRDYRQENGIVSVAKSSPLFLPFAQSFLDGRRFKNEKSRACWQRTVSTVCLPLHDKPVHKVTIADVIGVLKPIWETTPSVAREARMRIEMILDAAVALGHIGMEQRNPAVLKLVQKVLPALKMKGTIRGNHANLSYRLMPQFWCELRAIDTMSAKTLQMLILTAVRTNEQLQMAFNQVVPAEHEEGARRWVIPGKVMKHKAGLNADIPMSPMMLQILGEMEALRVSAKETLVFPSHMKLGEYGVMQGERTLLKLVQETMGYNGRGAKPKITVHGFRSTFRSWGQDETTHSSETLEFCLHHIEGSAAAQAYKQGSMWAKRRAALRDWEAFVTSLEQKKNMLDLAA